MTPDLRQLVRSYLIGFVVSLGLTLGAFLVTTLQVGSDGDAYTPLALAVGLVTLAITQLVVQLLFFFHLGREAKPRLNTVSFLFMVMVVGIVGLGSLWIMYHLDYNMTPRDVETFIKDEEGIDSTGSETHDH